MAEDHLPFPPAPTIEVCYRHPGVQTRVHCTRCDRPICPDCMIPAPVGHQCPECVEQAQVFVCGPAPMMDQVERSLAQLCVPADRVHTERFDMV